MHDPRYFDNYIDVNHLLWMDVETTGLRPDQGELLLEVAGLVTDLDLNEIPGSDFQAVIHHDLTTLIPVRAAANDIVEDMHRDSGLWDKVSDPAQSSDQVQIDREIQALLQRVGVAPRKVRLAGASVRLDLNFVEHFLPITYAHLHYRMYDVSTIDLFVKRLLPMPTQRFVSDHTAMADIRKSLEFARYQDSIIKKAAGLI